MSASKLFIEAAEAILQPWSDLLIRPAPDRLDVTIAASHLYPAVAALVDSHWGYLAAITGLDLGPEVGTLEVLYHFAAGPAVCTLRVKAPREKASMPSICHIVPSASLYERELSEMLGVTVRDTPDASRLFLPDDWPDGLFPLRKDARFE
jgi:Ni,Fe-hydrogenase III component G